MLIPRIVVSEKSMVTSKYFERHTTDLLEHLVHVAKDSPVQIPVLVNGETVLKSTLRHLEDSVLDCIELALNRGIVFWKI